MRGRPRLYIEPILKNIMLNLFQEQGYNGAVRLGSRAFQYVTNLVMQTAIKVSCY